MSSESQATGKKRSSIFRKFLYIVPVIAIIAAILLGYTAVIVATGESYPFTIVLGPSMQPTIMPGSVAVIDSVPFNQLKVGDVIVFEPQLALLYTCDSGHTNSLLSETGVPCAVIHRIVAISNNSEGQRILTTKGDNNGESIPMIDTNINSTMYIGKVILQFPEAGYITTYPTNEILALLILVGLGGEMLYERRQNKRKTQMESQSSAAATAASAVSTLE